MCIRDSNNTGVAVSRCGIVGIFHGVNAKVYYGNICKKIIMVIHGEIQRGVVAQNNCIVTKAVLDFVMQAFRKDVYKRQRLYYQV